LPGAQLLTANRILYPYENIEKTWLRFAQHIFFANFTEIKPQDTNAGFARNGELGTENRE
jgi:hypothetical protein